ncbi:MAG: hypothetical protein HYU66_12460 [Armatimonadetes bacterium]|nr:hypothetical protein [Armatimonadota bacterium]
MGVTVLRRGAGLAVEVLTHAVTADRPDGMRHDSLAAAMIRFPDSEYRGARVIYLWGNLAQGELGEKLLAGCLREVARQDPRRARPLPLYQTG